MKKEQKEFATFIMPPPYYVCDCKKCFGLVGKNIPFSKGETYPVVRREKTTPQECIGGERVYIRRACGKVVGWSVVYFSFKNK